MNVEVKRPLKVFLCHASNDKPAVRDLYRLLCSDGIDAWLDEEKILPGQDWNNEILAALQESDAIVICLSKASIAKEGYVQVEIKKALNKAEEKPTGTIYVIPARIDDCAVPGYLTNWQWVDLFSQSGHEQLMRSLRRRANEVGATIDPLEEKELEERLERLYIDGVAAYHTEDWEKAFHRFSALLRERPENAQAAQKLIEVKQKRQLAALYNDALHAQELGSWQAAVTAFEKLTREAPDYKDAPALLEAARKKMTLVDLYEEARRLRDAEQWQAVIAVLVKISKIDPSYPDPERLKDTANQRVAESARHAELNELYGRAVREIDAGQWHTAQKLLKQIQKIQFGFLETERLLVKVESEVKHVDSVKLNELGKYFSAALKRYKAITFVLLLVLISLVFFRGFPVRASLSRTQTLYLYSQPEHISPQSGLGVVDGSTFYLCRHDQSSGRYLIANSFWDCLTGKTRGWANDVYFTSSFMNVFVRKQP